MPKQPLNRDKGAKLNPEQKAKRRRMNKARRLWKTEPLFAFVKMQECQQQYAFDSFVDDLRRRTKKKTPKKTKSPLPKYGRFSMLQEMLRLYEQTKDPKYGLRAIQLRRYMCKPYVVRYKQKGFVCDFYFDPVIPYGKIETIAKAIAKCKTEQEATHLAELFRSSINKF